jgi:hypothetical protein
MRAVLGWGAMALFAASLVLVEVNNIRKSFDAKSWPTVEATVVSSAPEQGCGKGSSYIPRVRYQYTVNGSKYLGDVLAYSMFDCGGFEEMKTRTDAFPKGQQVQAHVNPAHPSHAVLVAGVVHSDSKFGIALFAILFLGCAHYARQAWRGAA